MALVGPHGSEGHGFYLGQTQFCGMEGTESVASATGLWVWNMLRTCGLGFEGHGHSMDRGSEGNGHCMGPWV